MASVQYCRMYPHQFSRMTHDVSLENLSAISEGRDNEFGSVGLNALLVNNNNNIGKATGPGSSENFDLIIRHAEPYQKSIHNRNSWAEGSSSKGVHQTKLSMRPRMGSDVDDAVLTSSRRLSESDEVFVKDDVTEAQRRNHDGVILEKARRLKGSRKGRKPRKLPEIPATSPPNKESPATRPTTLERELSLADELFEADPNLKPSIGKSDSFHKHVNVDCLEDENNLEVEPSTSGRVTPPENNEMKVKAEETTVETPDKDHKEFFENAEFIDDEPRPQGCLNNSIILSLNGTAKQSKAFLSSRNVLLEECSSPEEETRVIPPVANSRRNNPLFSAGSSSECGAHAASTRRSSSSSSISFDSDDFDATHRGCHKFVPRHGDEIFIEIGDPIFVEVEADDLWCEGMNLRTGKRGIFPTAYATDLSLLEDENGVRQMKFKMQFLGSIEVHSHKGIEVLTQAIHRVALTRRMTLNTTPPPVCILEINEYGIKMSEKTKRKKKDKEVKEDDKKESIRSRLAKILSRQRENAELNHFFALKNIAFCGYHPSNDRYFGFITKHPTHSRFACHVFLGEKSTKVVAEAVGNAFTKFFKEYMAFVHPTEDIYLE